MRLQYLENSFFLALFNQSKNFIFYIAENSFFFRCLSVFLSIFIFLNDQEICQFFLLISFGTTLVVFLLIISKAVIGWGFPFLKSKLNNLTLSKVILFSLISYFLIISLFFSIFFIILFYDLDIILLNVLKNRTIFAVSNFLLYNLPVIAIFLAASIKNKDKFKLNYFLEIFFMGLSPFFFFLLLFSLGYLFFSFSTNYFNAYLFFVFIFRNDFLAFYHKTWKVTIQNSSLVWTVLRFSSGFPILFLDLLVSSEFALNGWGVLFSSKLNKPVIYNNNFIRGANYAAKMQIRAFSEKPSPSLILKFMEDQAIPTELRSPAMHKFLKEFKEILVINKLLLPHQTTIHTNSGLEAHHLFILNQYDYLKGYDLIPAVVPFMNEGFYILNPALNDPSYFSQLLAASAADEKLVAIIFLNGKWRLLTLGKAYPLNHDTVLLINQFIDLNKNQWSSLAPEVKKFPSIHVGVEDILAIHTKDLTQTLRIQVKTEWAGLTGKTFIAETSSVLINKFAPKTGEALLLEKGKTIDRFKLSYEDPKLKKFCSNLFKDPFKMDKFIHAHEKPAFIENTIAITIKDKLNK